MLVQDKATGGLPPSFSTYSSSTATDLAFDVNAFLSQTSRKGLSGSLKLVRNKSRVPNKIARLCNGILLLSSPVG